MLFIAVDDELFKHFFALHSHQINILRGLIGTALDVYDNNVSNRKQLIKLT